MHQLDDKEAARDSSSLPPLREATRTEARKRIEKRRNLAGGLIAYVVLNAGLIAIWATTGRGYFWPGWVLTLWGVGLLLGWFDSLRRPVSDADIEAEVRKIESRRR
jgi:hypothetical protein